MKKLFRAKRVLCILWYLSTVVANGAGFPIYGTIQRTPTFHGKVEREGKRGRFGSLLPGLRDGRTTGGNHGMMTGGIREL